GRHGPGRRLADELAAESAAIRRVERARHAHGERRLRQVLARIFGEVRRRDHRAPRRAVERVAPPGARRRPGDLAVGVAIYDRIVAAAGRRLRWVAAPALHRVGVALERAGLRGRNALVVADDRGRRVLAREELPGLALLRAVARAGVDRTARVGVA